LEISFALYRLLQYFCRQILSFYKIKLMLQNPVFLLTAPGGTEWLFIILAVLVLFGGKKIPEFMRGLGKGIREFNDAKDHVKREIEEGMKQPPTPPPYHQYNQAPGQPYQGQPYQGQPYQGQPYQGQPYQGQPYQGQPYQAQPSEGQPYQGQPYQAQPANPAHANGQEPFKQAEPYTPTQP
jgi:sec-independent protein translocase protein TatA